MTLPETQPLVAHAAAPTPAAVGRAKALLQHHAPRRLPAGSQGRLRLSQGEEDLILPALPQALPNLRARMNPIGNTAEKQAPYVPNTSTAMCWISPTDHPPAAASASPSAHPAKSDMNINFNGLGK